MASTSKAKDDLTIPVRQSSADDADILENGGHGLSPNPSIRTDDDACSEIVRIEQIEKHDEEHNPNAIRKIVRSLQVRGQVRNKSFYVYFYTFLTHSCLGTLKRKVDKQ